MPLFTSDGERRLWLWTLAVVTAIYSTLGLAATLAKPFLIEASSMMSSFLPSS